MSTILDRVQQRTDAAALAFQGKGPLVQPSGSSATVSDILGMATAVGGSEEDARLMMEIESQELSPDNFAIVFDDLVKMVETKYPDKSQLLRRKLAATLGVSPDAADETLLSKIKTWGANNKGKMTAILLAIAAVVGTGIFLVWWRNRANSTGDASFAYKAANASLGTTLMSSLERYASINGGDGVLETINGRSPEVPPSIDEIREVVSAVDLLRATFGSVAATRAAYIALHGLELSHFDLYVQTKGL
jgi:hypothetical protein